MPQPTAFEQELLELLNRARADPAGEPAQWIADIASQTGTSAALTSALRYFNVDAQAFHDQLAAFSAVAPLAWNDALASAAEGHSAALIAADEQSHQVSGEAPLGRRIADAGYANARAWAENVYAYAPGASDAHAGFVIDWGYDAEDFNGTQLLADWQARGDGMQDPAGHRDTILSASYTEVGIGVLAESDPATSVGPYVVTQNFGNRWNYEPQLLGVVLQDADGDRFYDAGEGLGGISVTLLQGGATVASTTTWDAGGYQLALGPGDYTLRFSGGALTGVIEQQITMGTENLKRDGFAADARSLPTEGADQLAGTTGAEVINALGGDDWITPGGGSDTVDGGAGRDMLSFFDLPDTAGRTNTDYRLDIDMAAGTAVSHDGAEAIDLSNIERVTGTIFADRIRGTDGNDEIRGLGDYDWIVATTGFDTYDGGSGQDMVSFIEWDSSQANVVADIFSSNGAPPSAFDATGVVVDFTNSNNVANLSYGKTLTSIERITGSGRQDVFYGDAGENDFRGLGDYDWFVSSEGGRERYFGGDGIDTVTYYNASAGIIANLSNGARVNGQETGYGSGGVAARDLYFEIENLVGSRFDDELRGSSGRNQLNGLEGDDFIFGYGGVDYLKGGLGNDVIDGGGGSDYALFDGNAGDYTLARSGNEVTVTGTDGTDRLIDVEYFRFDDGDVDIWSL
ncbi:CAP domain-containing protein [Marinovum sp.]|uniref:CAP domain-containing protein n=1 Tax=Marinovum sp. TaxID=2024839 RepID=UPI003A8E14C7